MKKTSLMLFKLLIIIIIITLIVIDFLIFHDYFKTGENYTLVEYLTGIVSIPVILILGWFLIKYKK